MDEKDMSAFWKKHEKEMKAFGMLSKYEESQKYLLEHSHLVHEHMASFLSIWCIDLCVEEVGSKRDKLPLLKQVAYCRKRP